MKKCTIVSTDRDKFKALSAEDIILLVAASRLRPMAMGNVGLIPSQWGYERHGWRWSTSNWNAFLSYSLMAIIAHHANNFLSMCGRKKTLTRRK